MKVQVFCAHCGRVLIEKGLVLPLVGPDVSLSVDPEHECKRIKKQVAS